MATSLFRLDPFNSAPIARKIASAVAAASFTVAGCTTAPTPHEPRPTQEEISAAQHAEADCLRSWVAKLDDGVSPANVVGYQVGERCGREILVVSTISLPDRGREDASIVMPMFPRLKVDAGTAAVLSVRSARLSGSAGLQASGRDGEQSPQAKVLEACLAYQVARLDDGVSPASEVGHRVGQNCAEEFRAVAESHLRDQDPQSIQRAHEVALEGQEKFGTAAVISARSRAKGAQNAAP